MTKEDILAKSRQENKGKDIEVLEVQAKACRVTVSISAIFAGVMFLMQMLAGGGTNWTLWAMLSVMNLSMQTYMAIKLKRARNIFSAVCWGITSLIVTTAAIYSLIIA